MVSSVALANLFLQTQTDPRGKTFVLADLAPEGIEVLALRDRALVYSKRSVKQEGQTLRDILRREVELAAGKVRLGPEDTIEKIVLTGEESEAAQQEVIQDLGDCELLSSGIQFEMPDEQYAHLQEGTTSLGLAYSGIVRRPPMKLNLLPAELQVQQTRWAYVPSIILGALIVVLLVGLGFPADDPGADSGKKDRSGDQFRYRSSEPGSEASSSDQSSGGSNYLSGGARTQPG